MSQNVFLSSFFANWYQPTSLLIVLEEDIYYHSSDVVYHSLKATNNYTNSRRRASLIRDIIQCFYKFIFSSLQWPKILKKLLSYTLLAVDLF